MALFGQKHIQTYKADINPAPKASLARKVGRYKRLLSAQERAMKRGDVRKCAVIEAELEALSGNLLEEKAAIEQMLGK